MAESTIKGIYFFNPPISNNLNEEIYKSGFSILQYDSSTLATPYKDGLTGSGQGLVLTFMVGQYGTQTVYPNGNIHFYRRSLYASSSGGITTDGWKVVMPE